MSNSNQASENKFSRNEPVKRSKKAKLSLNRKAKDRSKEVLLKEISDVINGHVNLDQTVDSFEIDKGKPKTRPGTSQTLSDKKLTKKPVKNSDKPKAECIEEPDKVTINDDTGCTTEETHCKTCNVCKKSVLTDDFSGHVRKCLTENFKRTNPNPGVSTILQIESSVAKGPASTIYCQICQIDMSEMSVSDREEHVNKCIDKGTANTSIQSDADVIDTMSPTIVSLSKFNTFREDPLAQTIRQVTQESQQSDNTVCHICKKNLESVDQEWRIKHIDRCIDKAEKKQKNDAEAMEKARNKVLDCPLCGKQLKTYKARQTHLKKCAVELQVAPKVLMERVKEQEREYKMQLEAGILPSPTGPRPKKRRPAAARGTAGPAVRRTRLHVIADETPTSKLDEDTQLAIALSASVDKDQEKQAADRITQNVDAFSILMSPKPKEKKKKGSRKKKERVGNALTELQVVTEEDQQRRTRIKMEDMILTSSESVGAARRSYGTPKFKSSGVRDRYINLELEDEKDRMCWDKHWTPMGACQDNTGFYVHSVKQIVPLPPLFERKLNQIPGIKTDSQKECGGAEEKKAVTYKSPNDTTMLASTQTAVLLAEMANETLNRTKMDLTMVTPGRPKTDNMEQTGFFPNPKDDKTDRETKETLLANFGSMVNNPLMSDVQILVRDSCIHAHKFVLACRAPNLLKACKEDVSAIDLKGFSREGVLVFLEYLYAASIVLHHSTVFEVKELASRYGLELLRLTCDEEITFNSIETRASCIEPDYDKDVEPLLRSTWGSDLEDESTMQQSSDVETERKFESSNNSSEAGSDVSDTDDREDGNKTLSQALLEKLEASFIADCAERSINVDSDDENSKSSELSAMPKISELDVPDAKVDTDVDHDSCEMEIISDDDDEVITSDAGGLDRNKSDGASQNDNVSQCLSKSAVGAIDVSDTDEIPATISISRSLRIADVLYHQTPETSGPVFSGITPDLFEDSGCMTPQLTQQKVRAGDVSNSRASPVVISDNDDMGGSQSPVFGQSQTSKVAPFIHTVKTRLLDTFNNTINSTESPTAKLSQVKRKHSSSSVSATLNSPACRSPFNKRTRRLCPDSPVFSAATTTCDQTENNVTVVTTGLEYGCTDDQQDSFNFENEFDESFGQGDILSVPGQLDCCKSPGRSRDTSFVVTHQDQNDNEDIQAGGNQLDMAQSSPENDSLASETINLTNKLPEDEDHFLNDLDSQNNPVDLDTAYDSQNSAHTAADIDTEDTPLETSPVAISPDGCVWEDFDDAEGIDDGYLRYSCSSSPSKDDRLSPTIDLVRDAVDHQTDTTLSRPEVVVQKPVKKFTFKKTSTSTKAKARNASPEKTSPIARNAEDPTIPTPPDRSGLPTTPPRDQISIATPVSLRTRLFGIKQPVATTIEETTPTRCPTVSANEVYDPPTDMDTDVSIIETPKSNVTNKNGHQIAAKSCKPWVPPSPYTPMPDYSNMETPVLKKNVQKYGVKPMPKKKMIGLLKHIHTETHAYETDPEVEPLSKSPPKSPPTKRTEVFNTREKSSSMDGFQAGDLSCECGSEAPEESSDSGDDDRSDCVDLPEESILESASPVKSKNLADAKKQKVWDYIRESDEFKLKVMMYEPVEFAEFQEELKTQGINIGVSLLMEFLDDHSIPFTMRNADKGKDKPKSRRKKATSNSQKERKKTRDA